MRLCQSPLNYYATNSIASDNAIWPAVRHMPQQYHSKKEKWYDSMAITLFDLLWIT
jgi:hypothetical protein